MKAVENDMHRGIGNLFDEALEKKILLGRIEQPLYSQLRIKLITKTERITYINVMRSVKNELNNEMN